MTSRPDRMIDLRSDTVTQPSPEMKRAMAEAELGDDVFGDDPTVNALQERAAEITGKEAALFVPSGTMADLISLMVHVPRGGEVIIGQGAHPVAHEAANYAIVAGAGIWPLPWDQQGRLDLNQIQGAIRDPHDDHEPMTSLVWLENPHADSMGQPLSADYIGEVAQLAHANGLPVHIDGARIFNAAVALATSAKELLAPVDSACFCLSKGLACPVGSVIVGKREFIRQARRARKMLGGGMRQAGVIAAPGLIALRDGPSGMIERLAEDHANARRLADGVANLPGVTGLDPTRVRTNFVFFELTQPDARKPFLDALRARGARMIPYPGGARVRAVTHYGITADDIDRTISGVRRALADVGLAPAPPAAVGAGG